MKLDSIINNLKNSQSVKISGDDVNYVCVEKSGKGDKIRFVRTLGNYTEVFKTIYL
jgi:16S rRNA U1498 N3-methylase RsmE